MALIECRNLTRSYAKGETTITPLSDLDLEVERGEFLALMGPSGSGKTTLLNLIAGIDRPTGGTLTIDGHDLTRMSSGSLASWRSDYIGYIFQLYNLVPTLTAYENVELPLLLTGAKKAKRQERVNELLDTVGLSARARHRPDQMSGGEQQRVAIARALINDPKILLADEPTGNLDSVTSEEIIGLLADLNKEKGLTVFLVSHEKERLQAYAGRIFFLKDGRLDGEQNIDI